MVAGCGAADKPDVFWPATGTNPKIIAASHRNSHSCVVLHVVIILNNHLGHLVGDLFLITGSACPTDIYREGFC
jgi:hypothetical protein